MADFGFCSPKICVFRGVGGVPEIFFLIGILLFCELGAHAKNLNPTTPPYGSLATVVRRKEKNTKNSALRHVSTKSSAQRRSDQKPWEGNVFNVIIYLSVMPDSVYFFNPIHHGGMPPPLAIFKKNPTTLPLPPTMVYLGVNFRVN